MRYLSVCSGIEAASVAWHELGWQPVGFAEIEKFPSQVLAHRFPGVPNYGDMTKFKEWDIEHGTIDLLVGGTPCQAFSVAGLRKGLADPRGNLALTFVAMVDHYRPEWVVWENVPGVLSSNGGRDFGAFLGALAELGYGFCYRVLDAQYFGVAQRRRRVFVVAHSSGDPRRAASVLFESESLRGDSPPSREAGQKIATDPRASASGGGCWWDGGQVSQTLDAVLTQYQTMPEKHRFPAVLQPIGLDEEQNASIDLFGTLKARTEGGGFEGTVLQPSLYESHPNDSRVTGPVEQCPTVSARWGTGGNNTPLVTDNSLGFQSKASFCTGIESGISVPITTESKPAVVYPDAVVQPGEALPLAYDDRSQAVSTDTHHTPLVTDGATAYSIAPGRQGTPEKVDDIHVTEQDTSRTLDGTCADPERRQGGTLIVQPSFAYDDRNQAVSMDTHHTLRGEAAGSRVSDAVVQSGEASAFSWQCRGDMRGMVPRPTAQLQRCQIEAVMVPEQSGYETVPALTASGRGVERTGESRGQDPVVAVNQDAVQVQWASGGGQVENPTAQALRSNAEHNYQFVRQWDASSVVAPSLTASNDPSRSPQSSEITQQVSAVVQATHPTMHVRRLTPVECERLQGFPDGWTDIRPGGKDTPDSPRYKALGNSMAVPVMRWIGMRIAEHTSADANHFVDGNKLVVVARKESSRG